MYKVELEVSKKTKKKNQEKKPKKLNRKKTNYFFCKIFCSVQFWFTKSETSKTPTEPN